MYQSCFVGLLSESMHLNRLKWGLWTTWYRFRPTYLDFRNLSQTTWRRYLWGGTSGRPREGIGHISGLYGELGLLGKLDSKRLVDFEYSTPNCERFLTYRLASRALQRDPSWRDILLADAMSITGSIKFWQHANQRTCAVDNSQVNYIPAEYKKSHIRLISASVGGTAIEYDDKRAL